MRCKSSSHRTNQVLLKEKINDVDEDQLADRVCISPTVKTFAETDAYLTFTRSHEWIIDRAEAYGNDAILNKIHCRNCGLERMAILADLQESKTNAKDYRRKLAQAIPKHWFKS